MGDAPAIVLGGVSYPVSVLTFREMRTLLPAINRAGPSLAVGRVTDDVINDLIVIFATAMGKTVAEVDAMPVAVSEFVPALNLIVKAAGLAPVADAEGSASGEAAGIGIGTTSMPG